MNNQQVYLLLLGGDKTVNLAGGYALTGNPYLNTPFRKMFNFIVLA